MASFPANDESNLVEAGPAEAVRRRHPRVSTRRDPPSYPWSPVPRSGAPAGRPAPIARRRAGPVDGYVGAFSTGPTPRPGLCCACGGGPNIESLPLHARDHA